MTQDGSYKIPKFDGSNHYFWKMRMESHLNSMNFEIWNFFLEGYTHPFTSLTTLNEIRAHVNNGKSRNAIISRLSNKQILKVMDYKFAKDVWEKLSNIYVGEKKIKEVNL